MTTIVLADDHRLMRQGVKRLLEAENDFSVIGEAVNGQEVCELIRELHPDIVVMDLMMDGLDGIEATRYIARHSPTTGIVALSGYDSVCYVLEALRAGAKAYVLKHGTSEELVTAIREVLKGKRYLSRPIPESTIEAYYEQTDSASSQMAELTARERDVFHLAAQGYTSAEIAERLFISRRTAECHRSRMMHKLGLRGQTDLVLYAVKQGISVERVAVPPQHQGSAIAVN